MRQVISYVARRYVGVLHRKQHTALAFVENDVDRLMVISHSSRRDTLSIDMNNAPFLEEAFKLAIEFLSEVIDIDIRDRTDELSLHT